MLVWINGAFGAGKTQTAFELHRRLSDSHVADPELIGYGIHRMLPSSARADFQDRPQWRTAVAATLADADRASTGPVIVPMTLVDPRYFDEIMGGLDSAGVTVRHFTLAASPDILRKRLSTRLGHVVGPMIGRDETWAMQQIPRCVSALDHERFADHIDTDHNSVDDNVELIAARAGLALQAPRAGRLGAQWHRVSVGVRHIRIG